MLRTKIQGNYVIEYSENSALGLVSAAIKQMTASSARYFIWTSATRQLIPFVSNMRQAGHRAIFANDGSIRAAEVRDLRVLLVVPYAALTPESPRPAQLQRFLAHMRPKDYIIAEQVGGAVFNKGLTYNAAIHHYLAHNDAPDYLLLHDVDILPGEKMMEKYWDISLTPIQLVPIGGKYPEGIPVGGGVTLIQLADFLQCNGFPNNFWGWGGEDNAFKTRLKTQNIPRYYAEGVSYTALDQEKTKPVNPDVARVLADDRRIWQLNGIGQLPEVATTADGHRITVGAVKAKPQVAYHSIAVWEYDFIRRDLLRDRFELVVVPDFEDLNSGLKNFDGTDRGDIVVASANARWPATSKVDRPTKILFFLSDEMGKFSAPPIGATELVLHNYNYLTSSSPAKMQQLPLGYASSYLSGRRSVDVEQRPINLRLYTFAFVGTIYSDRQEMLETFRRAFPNRAACINGENFIHSVKNTWKLQSLAIRPPEVFRIYSDSIFVPIGRGHKSLDCFRIYEAAVVGAIPVIVGPPDEIAKTFAYDGHAPPFLFYRSWDDAASACAAMLDDLPALQARADRVRQWWLAAIDRVVAALGQ